MTDIRPNRLRVSSMDAHRRRHQGDQASPVPEPVELRDLPLMLTVGEAAIVLRISRTSAYKLVAEHRATNGVRGLPHVRLGSRIMVRRVDLARIVGVDQPA